MEITSMSSKGQVVIPSGVREQLNLKEGEKFVVIGEEDTVVLKKIAMPSFKNFDKILKKAQQFAKEKSIKEKDVEEAIIKARK